MNTHKYLIVGHFDYMIYTDEVYVDLLFIIHKEALREERYQRDTENI
jgi:hypothetical protein